MANELKITERAVPRKEGYAEGPWITTQIMSPASGAGQSNAFNAGTNYIVLFSSLACYYKLGSNPTAAADATSIYLPANVERAELLDSGQTKLSVIV